MDDLRSLKKATIRSALLNSGKARVAPVEDPVVMKVCDGPEQLHHEALDLPGEEHLALLPHQLHQRLEVVRDKVHDDKDLVHIGAHDDLAHSDDVGVLRDEQRVDLPQGGDGEALLLALHLEPLQGDDLLSLLIAGAVHDAVGALFYAVQTLKCRLQR